MASNRARCRSRSFTPRKKSSAGIGFLPARCTSVRRTAPLPQAIVSLSSRSVPAGPAPSAAADARLDALALAAESISNQAPG